MDSKSSFLDRWINSGVKPNHDINTIRLIRQVNGLNLFFMVVAISIAVLVGSVVKDVFALVYIQPVAAVLYFVNILICKKGHYKIASKMTVNLFEWHIFLVILLTNAFYSPAIFGFVLYPLLAALVEVNIVGHLGISLLQLGILFGIHLFLPGFETRLMNISSLSPIGLKTLRLITAIYAPVMGAMIIRIIFQENIRAREKQKQMLNEIAITNRQLKFYADELKDETQRLRAEVEITQQIQAIVLPTKEELQSYPDLDIAGMMRPADEVGGDYYDVMNIDDVVTIGIGDVTGHGLASGVIMLMAQTSIRTIAEMKVTDPQQIITILNRVLYANILRINEDRNMTLALITKKNNEYVVSGQHENLLVCRKDGKMERIETVDLGFYVGLLPDIEDNLKSRKFTLNPGDTLVLYSDGITEGMNQQNEQFGLERLEKCIQKYHHQSAERIVFKIIRDVYNFIEESPVFDDITTLVIKQK